MFEIDIFSGFSVIKLKGCVSPFFSVDNESYDIELHFTQEQSRPMEIQLEDVLARYCATAQIYVLSIYTHVQVFVPKICVTCASITL